MEITSSELRDKINKGEKIIVDFHAKWCGPCKVMKPKFEQVSEEYRTNNHKVQLYTMDVDLNRDIAVELGIRAVPTIKLFSEGREVKSHSGVLMESQIKELANSLLNG